MMTKKELLAKVDHFGPIVWDRYYGDDDDLQYNHELSRPYLALMFAKGQAQKGNLAPLKKLYPKIADILDLVKPSNKRVRRDPWQSYKQDDKQRRVDNIKHIRQILKEETGQPRVEAELLVLIAAKILNCPPTEIREIVRRGR